MPTIADVAKLAGVSIGTVSRVLNGADNVNPGTHAKVTQAIATLGYEPNLQARSLRSKRTDTIALAIPELANYFWTTVARGVQDATQAKGYHVLICNTNGRPSDYLRYLQQMASRVDGMILSRRSERVVVSPDGTQSSQQINSNDKPIVFVGQSQAAKWNVDNVYSDSVSGAFTLTEHLISLQHEKIAIITGRQSSASATDRAAGYCMALANANLPLDPQRICWGEYDRKTAERLTQQLMERLPDTTAIVAANNEIAIGVIQGLEKLGIPVPEAVAVVCFDDFYPDSRFATMMTVASQSPYDLGLNAAQLLLNRLNSDDYLRPQTIVLPARLIVRQSTGSEPTPVEPTTAFDNVQGRLIPSLTRQKLSELAEKIEGVVQFAPPLQDDRLLHGDKSQATALKQALRHEHLNGAPVPHFEYAVTNRLLYRYVLEREPETEFVRGIAQITPEDQVRFAQRTGIGAIPCRFPYQPRIAQPEGIVIGEDDSAIFDFPLLTDQIDFFDRYVRAAQNTNICIAADFRSIAADTLRAVEALAGLSQPGLMQRIADELLAYQSKVVQVICDRFSADLAFVMFSDELANEAGLKLPMDEFEAVFSARIQRLTRPAKEHGLTLVLHTPGSLKTILPLVQRLRFDALYIAEAEADDLPALKESVNGSLSLMGGISPTVLSQPEQLQAVVAQLAAGGGYAAGLAGEIDQGVSIEQFFSLLGSLTVSKGFSPKPNAEK